MVNAYNRMVAALVRILDNNEAADKDLPTLVEEEAGNFLLKEAEDHLTVDTHY